PRLPRFARIVPAGLSRGCSCCCWLSLLSPPPGISGAAAGWPPKRQHARPRRRRSKQRSASASQSSSEWPPLSAPARVLRLSRTNRLLRTLAVVGLAASAATATATAAAAAPSPAAATSLSFGPTKGLDITPMYLVVPKACPVPATNVVALTMGHGMPADGQPV